MLPRDESRWCRIESVDGNRELLRTSWSRGDWRRKSLGGGAGRSGVSNF
jgi:hypothetical protein